MSPSNTVGTVAEATGLRARLDVSPRPSGDLMHSLTSAVTELCERGEDARGDGPIVVELTGVEPEDTGVSGWPQELSITTVNRWERAVRRLERLDAPTVAVTRGGCSGPALDLLLATDYRIGTGTTRLGLAREAGNLWPGMALHRLVQQAGLARVRRLALFGQELTAAEALELGLLDEMTADVEAALSAVTLNLRGLAGTELAVRRRLLLEAAVTSHEEAIGVHLSACDRTLRRGGAAEVEDAS